MKSGVVIVGILAFLLCLFYIVHNTDKGEDIATNVKIDSFSYFQCLLFSWSMGKFALEIFEHRVTSSASPLLSKREGGEGVGRELRGLVAAAAGEEGEGCPDVRQVNFYPYIQKGGFRGFRNPQTILNFPQKDCLRMQKLSR